MQATLLSTNFRMGIKDLFDTTYESIVYFVRVIRRSVGATMSFAKVTLCHWQIARHCQLSGSLWYSATISCRRTLRYAILVRRVFLCSTTHTICDGMDTSFPS